MHLHHLLILFGLSGVAWSNRFRYNEIGNKIIQMKCGQEYTTLKSGGSHFYVLNGKNVTQQQMNREAPWVVSINYDSENLSKNHNISCTGTLISARHVMTAAHCLVYPQYGWAKCNDETLEHKTPWEHGEPSRFRIRAGTICGNRHCTDGETYEVKRIIYPHSFTNGNPPNSDCKLYNYKDTEDIAIFELTKDVWGADFPCLAQKTIENVELTNYGYGKALESKPERNALKKHTTKYVNCRQQWPQFNEMPNGVDCTLHNGQNTTVACVGDSGGPVVAKYNGRTYIVGVLTSGTRCADAQLYPSNIEGDMMTSVPYYLNWICKWTGICPEGADPTKDKRPTAILE